MPLGGHLGGGRWAEPARLQVWAATVTAKVTAAWSVAGRRRPAGEEGAEEGVAGADGVDEVDPRRRERHGLGVAVDEQGALRAEGDDADGAGREQDRIAVAGAVPGRR